jgi:hypothetical protein
MSLPAASIQTQADREDAFSVLKALAEASAVIVAVTFVGGWSYLSSYYRTFGLNPLELDLSMPVVSTIALYILYKSVWPLLVFGALLIFLALVAGRTQTLRRGWVVAALGILLLAVSAAGLMHGRSLANKDMLQESSTLPYVAFATKGKLSEPSCVESGAFGTLDCKLLLHQRNTYYFFQPVPGQNAGNMNLYILSDSDVEGVHIQRGLTRNLGVE